jgi:transposase InsO family protein
LQDVLVPGNRKAVAAVLQVKVAVAPKSVPRLGARAALQIPEKSGEVHHRSILSRLSWKWRPQFIAKEFKEFIRISGMTHVRTSPYYPQSNGRIERWHESLKGECIRPGTPLSMEDARRLVKGHIDHYNDIRLNSAIGYISPKDLLAGHQQDIQAERDRKLEAAREQRKNRRQRPRD